MKKATPKMYWMGTLSNITEKETISLTQSLQLQLLSFLHNQSSFGRWRQGFYLNGV